ncbi:hypothetical protein JP74_21760 [Devosia sp. 17-2-E-8]|nr:hypothetical protein JP74_21760 [Devosia sp. 17-2-E-8]
MRLLVAVACVAVIAFVGYFFWGEWNAYRAREEVQTAAVARVEQSRQNIEALLKTAPPEWNTVPTMCRQLMKIPNPANAGREGFVEDCRILGY